MKLSIHFKCFAGLHCEAFIWEN